MLSWLFRPQCAACGALCDDPLCSACGVSLVEVGDACPICAQPKSGASPCRRCLVDPLPLECIVAPWRFGGALASAIRRLKFAGATHVARTLAPLWAPVLAAAVDETDAIVVPVPLHWRRRLQRGFDQAWLLARHACSLAGIAPPVTPLRRVRHTAPQSTLAARERADNIAGAFAARGKIAGRAVVLIDDVVTTGATMAAAAHALKRAGASRVLGVALARAE